MCRQQFKTLGFMKHEPRFKSTSISREKILSSTINEYPSVQDCIFYFLITNDGLITFWRTGHKQFQSYNQKVV